MSEFNSADIKDIQARLIPDESFREAVCELGGSIRNNKLVKADFLITRDCAIIVSIMLGNTFPFSLVNPSSLNTES